jgi:hypothetical protein
MTDRIRNAARDVLLLVAAAAIAYVGLWVVAGMIPASVVEYVWRLRVAIAGWP